MRLTGFTHVMLAGILFLGVVGAYGAWYAYVDRVSAEAAAIREDIVRIKQGSAAAADTQRMLESLSGTEETIRSYFVSTQDVVPFLESLGREGERLGSRVEVVSVSELPKSSRGGITVGLKISGSFDSVLRTLGSLEYSPRDIEVEKVTLDAVSAAEGVVWTAQATAIVGTSNPENTP